MISWGLTIFSIIVITNSFNLIDGIDGLAGSVALLVFTFFGLWFFLTDNLGIAYIIFAFIGSIIAFLIFNWQPSKIFMGDTGALLIGFMVAYLSVLFINTNYHLSEDSSLKFSSSISTTLCILIIPLMDTLRVFVLRILKSQSPFHADNNHIHHLLVKLGLGHAWSVIILIGINSAFMALAILGRNFSDLIMIPALLGLALLTLGTLSVFLNKKISKTQAQETTVK